MKSTIGIYFVRQRGFFVVIFNLNVPSQEACLLMCGSRELILLHFCSCHIPNTI